MIVCSDLSRNRLDRAHLLAKLLERNYSIEVIGPEIGDSIWDPLRTSSITSRLGVELSHVDAAPDCEISRPGGG